MDNFRKRLVKGLVNTKTVTKLNSRKSYTISPSSFTVPKSEVFPNVYSEINTKYNITTRSQYVYGDGYTKWGNDVTTKDVTFTNRVSYGNNTQGIFYISLNNNTANPGFSLNTFGTSRFEISHTKAAGTYKYYPTLTFTYYDYNDGTYKNHISSVGSVAAPSFHIEVNKPDSSTIVGTVVSIVQDN